MAGLVDHLGRPMKAAPAAAPAKRNVALSGGASSWFPYDASSWVDPQTDTWFPYTYSPDYEIDIHRDRMVGRSRDLVRNDGWAAGGIQSILDETIGGHYRLSARPDLRALQFYNKGFDVEWAADFREAVEARWRSYADDPYCYCDATQQLTLTQMARLALSHKLVDGEDLIVMDWLPERMGYDAAQYATAVRLIDPDRLSNPMDMVDTLHLRGGVEIDDSGVPVAYHIRRAHQFDWYGAVESMIWDRVPRRAEYGRTIVIHDYDRGRTDQHRGVPIFTPIMNRMKMLTKYDQVELQSAIINAVFALFMKSPNDPEGLREALDGGEEDVASLGQWYWNTYRDFRQKRAVNISGATVVQGFAGEEPVPLQANRPGSSHDPFTHYCLRNIAAGLQTTAPQLTRDWSKANYSSLRGEMQNAVKTVVRRRYDFDSGTMAPIYCCWLEESMDKGELPMPGGPIPEFMEARAAYSRHRFIGPGRGFIDPVKEAQAITLRRDALVSTLQTECDEQGADWRELVMDAAQEIAFLKKHGVPAPKSFGLPQETLEEPASEQSAKPHPQ